MWAVVYKLDGSVNPPALVAPAHAIHDAARDFFASEGPHGGLNDARASQVTWYPTREAAVEAVMSHSITEYDQPLVVY